MSKMCKKFLEMYLAMLETRRGLLKALRNKVFKLKNVLIGD